ncbi:MAG: hypothetical protein ACR2FY_07870 [Pirellulaceae bacterium]
MTAYKRAFWKNAFVVGISLAIAVFGSRLSFGETSKGPPVFERGKDGQDHALEGGKLFAFEQELRANITKPDAPDEIFLLSWSFSSIVLEDPPKVTSPRSLIVVEVRGKAGILRFVSDFGKKKAERELSADQMRRFQDSVAKAKADQLSRLESNRFVEGRELAVAGGRVYVYLHLTAKEGHRVWMNNPPTKEDTKTYPAGDPLWDYTHVVDLFTNLNSAEKSPTPPPMGTKPMK